MTFALALLAATTAPVPAQAVSAAELGNVIATLNDWRAILVVAFAMMGALILMVGGLVVMIIRMATSRSTADQATLEALKDNTRSNGEVAAGLRALEMIAARRESERAP